MQSTEEQQTPATAAEETVTETATATEEAPAAEKAAEETPTAAGAEAAAEKKPAAEEAESEPATAVGSEDAGTEDVGDTDEDRLIVNLEPHAADEVVEEDSEFQRMVAMYDETMRNLSEGEIVNGRVIAVTSNDVVIDVGYKSEGLVPRAEFTDHDGELTVAVGDEVDVLLEKTEDIEGHILLSHQKAQRMKRWNEIERAYKEGSIIKGRIADRIKGGLTVDIGLRAFLPGSLVDIKPIKHLESLKGEELEFKVISLDRRRNNVVLSRKAVLEKELEKKKAETITKLKDGALLPGVVKNITDYGVFIDLGGIDGLLHITDISWGRVNHPSEHFAVGDEVEIVILKFDPETERVSLGFKQKSEDPWTLVDKKYPIGSRVNGRVVSLVDYGAFVEIEEGVEGLIHVSEMSWTKKVVNPAKILEVEDEVEAIVSELDMDQRRISLSLRQTERNPWEELEDTHPVGTIIEGKVRNLTEFGAFVEIIEGIDGLIHVSDMSWTKRVKHPSEVLKKGDVVKARITNIDTGSQRVSLSIKEFMPNEWEDFVAAHHVGDTCDGKVVNVTDFGLFIDIYQGLEGLAHVSEIDLPPGAKAEDHYRIGDWVRARILRLEDDERKVGLTMRGLLQPTSEEVEALEKEAAELDDGVTTRDAAKESVVVEVSEAEKQEEVEEAKAAEEAQAADEAEKAQVAEEAEEAQAAEEAEKVEAAADEDAAEEAEEAQASAEEAEEEKVEASAGDGEAEASAEEPEDASDEAAEESDDDEKKS